jgi:hypothetical protein
MQPATPFVEADIVRFRNAVNDRIGEPQKIAHRPADNRQKSHKLQSVAHPQQIVI